MHVVIMSGISGSGKDTYIKQRFPNKDYLLNVPVCSADDYFMVDGKYQFDASKLSAAHGQCLKDFISFLQDNKAEIVVVNNTNTTVEEIAPYYSIAKAYGATVELVTLVINPEKAAARNVHNVPLAACQAMHKRINQRKLPPFWKLSSEAVIPTD